jgi:predicted nucleotidyltransferase component of viral defense system
VESLIAVATLTRALVGRHGAGRSDTWDAALLDVAQDHLLFLLAELSVFDSDDLVLKGGTSLRKCRLGGIGRFSTDLDFACPDEDTVIRVCEAIDGGAVAGFRFRLASTRGDGRHWALTVDHDELGTPSLRASVEFARRRLILTPERRAFIPLPIHKAYDIQLPVIPVIAEPEACAEKLARYRRDPPLGRDVYDLSAMSHRPIDESLVRRLWILKAWADVVDEGRGAPPIDPADILRPRREQDFADESIGKLTQPVDLASWEQRVRERFAFLAELDFEEKRWAQCDPRMTQEIVEAAKAIRT